MYEFFGVRTSLDGELYEHVYSFRQAFSKLVRLREIRQDVSPDL